MSFQAMAWAVKQDTKNTGSKLVLLMLANYADEHGSCYPSQAHLAQICHCTRQSVNAYIGNLVKLGLVSIKKKSNGLLVHNIYNLKISNVHITDNASSNVKNLSKQSKDIRHNTINNTIPNVANNFLEEKFLEFWENVPKKTSKKQTKKLFVGLIGKKVVAADVLICRIKEYKQFTKDTESILHPATWLNQQRWEDELEVTMVKSKNFLAG